MTHQKGFEPHLAFGETTVSARDIEMLRAIHHSGSMYKAAGELGRSYPHLQRRVVELEEAIGSLTDRVRGGEGGGGTRLTPAALDLIRSFERLRVELAGAATVTESVISGTVVETEGDLATVNTPAGELSARVPEAVDEVEIAVRADAVVLMNPGSVSQRHTSLRNQLDGVVRRLVITDAVASVTVEVADGVTIASIVTEESVERLGLAEGDSVVAAFKTTAARATPAAI